MARRAIPMIAFPRVRTILYIYIYIYFMARRAIPIIVFPRVRTIYIYIYLCPLARVCVVYVVKEVASFPGAGSVY